MHKNLPVKRRRAWSPFLVAATVLLAAAVLPGCNRAEDRSTREAAVDADTATDTAGISNRTGKLDGSSETTDTTMAPGTDTTTDPEAAADQARRAAGSGAVTAGTRRADEARTPTGATGARAPDMDATGARAGAPETDTPATGAEANALRRARATDPEARHPTSDARVPESDTATRP